MKSLILLIFLLSSSLSFGAAQINFRVVEPLFGDGEWGQLLTDCSFDSHTFECLVDTGARISIVNEDQAFSDYEIVDQEQHGGVHGNAEMVDIISIGTTDVGPLSLNNHRVRRFGKGVAAKNPILGNDLFRGNTMTFDFNEKAILLEDRSPVDAKIFTLDNYKNKWIGLPISMAGNTEKSLWDTGASLTIVDKSLPLRSPENFKFIREIDAADASGTSIKAKVYKTTIQFSDFSLNNVTVVALDFSKIQEEVDPEITVVVGYNIYSKYNWLIDYKNFIWSAWER